MPKPYFTFKQFTVYHDRSSLKVGTDAVLLGAWADTTNAKRILDIGTGCGVIALMLAQRSNAQIDAIDIDEESYKQAKENFLASPWSQRLEVYNIALNDFAPTASGQYDLIVSNPPYFTASYKPSDPQRFCARHNDQLPINELAKNSAELLSHSGKLAVILPLKEAAILTDELQKYNLFPEKELFIIPLGGREPFRKMLLFSRHPSEYSSDELIIETAPGQGYSKEYIALTRDYYLNFE